MAYAVREHEVSQKRVCGLVRLRRSSFYYKARPRDDQGLREALKEKAAQRRRFGYRRLVVMLRREGWKDNHKRMYRVYREERLQVRRRKRRRTARWRGEKPVAPGRINQRWSMDFAQDALADGRRIRVLSIVDDYTRECLGLEVDTSVPGARVTRVLARLKECRGLPEGLLTDNGPEFIGKALDTWAYREGVRLEFIQARETCSERLRGEFHRETQG